MFTSVFLSSPFIFIRLKLLKNSLNSRFFVTLLTKQCCSLHFVLLTVQPQSVADAQVPTIVEDPNQSVLIGSNVTFNCTAAVRTRPTIMNKGQRFISLWIQPQSRNYSKRIKVFYDRSENGRFGPISVNCIKQRWKQSIRSSILASEESNLVASFLHNIFDNFFAAAIKCLENNRHSARWFFFFPFDLKRVKKPTFLFPFCF